MKVIYLKIRIYLKQLFGMDTTNDTLKLILVRLDRIESRLDRIESRVGVIEGKVGVIENTIQTKVASAEKVSKLFDGIKIQIKQQNDADSFIQNDIKTIKSDLERLKK